MFTRNSWELLPVYNHTIIILYLGVNRYGLMPEIKKKIIVIDGEREKQEKNMVASNDSNKKIGNEYQMIPSSRVGDTLDSLGQGMFHLRI